MIAKDQLQSIFSRWQKLEEAKAEVSQDLRELFAEAKGNGRMNGKLYSQEEINTLKQLHSRGYTAEKIAHALDRSVSSIHTKRKALGLIARPKYKASVIEMAEAGHSWKHISEVLGTTYNSVCGIYSQFRLDSGQRQTRKQKAASK